MENLRFGRHILLILPDRQQDTWFSDTPVHSLPTEIFQPEDLIFDIAIQDLPGYGEILVYPRTTSRV